MSFRPPSMGSDAERDVVTLVDELIAEQRELTAVERFGRQHDRGDRPLLEKHYRDLIPLSAPLPGEQYAFEVELDACSGCKACVSACHSLNGLDEEETWRGVGMLRGVEAKAALGKIAARTEPVARFVTTACHHCVEPACLLGCPVLAYDKDPATGIVRHLDDQCIGCSYCILKCPYEVPKYSTKRGIVRKCDMCQGRLAVGEAPACVQGCPNAAIRIVTVRPEAVRNHYRPARVDASGALSDPNPFLEASPQPSYTLPTSRYITRADTALLVPADAARPRIEHTHWPLVLMLVLTQIGAGWLCGVAARLFVGTPAATLRFEGIAGCLLVVAGLVASAFHLGQPRKAWRVWMGWRTSWLSREAMVMGPLAGIATLFAASLWYPVPIAGAATVLGASLAAATLAAVFAQSMVYIDTHRATWTARETGPRFLGTALLGLLISIRAQPGVLIVATVVLAALECRVFHHRHGKEWTPWKRSAALLLGPLRVGTVSRFLLAAAVVAAVSLAVPAPYVLGIVVLSALAERRLYFAAVGHERMPGSPG